MKERKTDREILLEIFKRAGVNIIYEQDDYIEVEPETYGEALVLILTHKEILKNFYKITLIK